MFKRIKSKLPKGFFWRLTLLNVLVIATTIAISGWAIYHTACFLVEGIGTIDDKRQRQFNTTLFQYLWMFSTVGIIAGSIFHFYATKKLLSPVRALIDSTKQLQQGSYPKPIVVNAKDEMGELIKQYNSLITQLQANDAHREKLVSDVSHEFRTPLANLKGYLHGLKTGVIAGDQQIFESLYDQTERLTMMVEQLEQLKELDHISSKTLMDKQSAQLVEEVKQCVSMFEWTLSEKDIQITIDVEAVNLTVDREGIQRVLTNLIDNAIRYYKGNSPIRIKGESSAHAYQLSVSGPSEQIPKDEEQFIFERFYRVDESRSRTLGGTGLGLAIAKEIIEQHEGNIGLYEQDGETTFWFTLPYP